MKALLLTLSIISISLVISYTLLPNYSVFGPTLKIILKSYLLFWTFVSDENPDQIVESSGPPQMKCDTWEAVNDLMSSMLDDLKRLSLDLTQFSNQLIQILDDYLYNVKVQIDEFQNRLNKLNDKVTENPGPAGKILKSIHEHLDHIYNDICNATRTVVAQVDTENGSAVLSLKEFIWLILSTAYRTVLNHSLFEPDIMECVCDAVMEADNLYAKQYPNLRDCVVEFEDETEKIFNNTKYNFFTLKEMTGDDVVDSVSKSSFVDVMMYLPVKMANHNLLLEQVRSGFITDIYDASHEYTQCKNSVVDETLLNSKRITKAIGICYGEWDPSEEDPDYDYPVEDEDDNQAVN